MALLAACGGSPSPTETETEIAESSEAVVHQTTGIFTSGWDPARTVRLVKDVDGDGRVDLVGFGEDGMYVSLSQPGGVYAAPVKVHDGFSYARGWRVGEHPRLLADINGDGRPDAVGFGIDGVQVSLKQATGAGYDASSRWLSDLGTAHGWRVDRDVRAVGDINGDGKADLLAINDWAGYVALSNGSSFAGKQLWTYDFKNADGWNVTSDLRLLADINDDGRADVVGMGHDYLSWEHSKGGRFEAPNPLSVYSATTGFPVKLLANVNGDRFPDQVKFGAGGVQVALGDGRGGFSAPTPWSSEFGNEAGWDAGKHLRFLADIDRDGSDDVVGIKSDGVYVALAAGTSFGPSEKVLDDFTYDRGWRVDKHPRFVADVDGDGGLDLIGFFDDGVYWAPILTPVEPPAGGWEAPTCSAGGLAPPAPGYCSGPWHYSKVRRCYGTHSSCPNVCSDLKSCPKWENGATTVASSEPTAVRGGGNAGCTTRCTTRMGREEECNTTCGGDKGAQPLGACQLLANPRLDTLRNQAFNEVMAETTFDSAQARTDRANQAKGLVAVTPSFGVERFGATSSHSGGVGGISIDTYTWKERWACNLAVTYPAPVNADNLACGCDAYSQTSCEYDCGIDQFDSAPGLKRPAGPRITDQSCTTCDDRAISTAAGVSNRFTCLKTAFEGSAPGGVDAAQFKRAVMARLKLLFDWRANDLARDQRIYVLDRYDQPGQATCNPIAVDAACLEQGRAAGINNNLQMCKNLSAPGIALVAITDALPRCVALFDRVATLPEGACRAAYRDEVTATVKVLMERDMEVMRYENGQLTGVGAALADIDSWYDHARRVAFGDADWLRGQSSPIVAQMWRRAYDATSALPGIVDATNVVTVMRQLDGASFQTEYAVLNAAFAPGSSFDSPPLLAIVGDALRTSVERLQTVSEAHDLVCRYRTCTVSSISQTSELWRILASIGDASTLGTASTQATRLAAAHADIALAFRNIAARHANLAAAYVAAGGGSLDEIGFIDVLPPEAVGLAQLVRLAGARWGQFQINGRFLSTGERELHAGMQNKQLVIDQFTAAIDALRTEYEKYLSDRIQLVQGLIQQIRNGRDQATLETRWEQIVDRITNAKRELGALRAREASERATFADLRKAFDNMLASGVFDADVSARTDVLPSVRVAAANARFTGANGAPADYAVLVGNAPWKQTLSKGEAMRFSVTGQYAPSCAIQKAPNIETPVGSKKITKADALTGPEGYLLTWGGSDFEAKTHTSDSVMKEFVNGQVCLKTGYKMPGWITTAFGPEGEAYALACAGLDQTWSQGTSESHGHDNRTSASFEAGMHLPNTPYTDATAGALLLVSTPAGNPGRIIDIQVVGRQSTYLAPENVDVYLVVNDLKSAGCITKPDALTVEAVRTQTLGAIAGPLSIAMADTLTHIESQSEAILAQGALVQGEESLLRLYARQRVSALTGIDVTALPQAVQEFFDTWLSAEMVSLNRRAQIERQGRELRMAELERRGLAAELEAAGVESRLLGLIPRWQLRQLENSRLIQAQRAVLLYLRDYVPSIFELRFPRALLALLQSPDGAVSARAEMDALAALDFAASAEDLSGKLLAFANKAKTTLNTAVVDGHDYGVVMAAVSFPNPALFKDADAPPREGCGRFEPCNLPGAPPATVWHPVELTRAQQVFDGLINRGKATFTIQPGDLYDIHGWSGGLTCYDSAPIVRKLGLYAVTRDGADYSGMFYRPALEVGPLMSFPTGTELISYVKTDDDWLFTGIPVLGGAEIEALTDLIPHNSAAASGLSPFDSFTIDLHHFHIPPGGVGEQSNIQQLVLIFELETRPIAAPGVAIPECRQ